MNAIKQRIHNAALQMDIESLTKDGIVRYAMPIADERKAEIEKISNIKVVVTDDYTLELAAIVADALKEKKVIPFDQIPNCADCQWLPEDWNAANFLYRKSKISGIYLIHVFNN